MNILVIGNGFDLAHGLPTKYTDFLEFIKVIKQALSKSKLAGIDWGNTNTEVKKFLIYNKGKVQENLFSNRQMWEDLINNNIWIDYFLQNPIYQKENWIDFEIEISKVIQSLDNDVSQDNYDLDEIMSELSNEFLYQHYSKYAFNIQSVSTLSGEENESITYREIRDRLYNDLNRLIRALEKYMCEYMEKIDIDKKSPDIDKLEIDFILSFNYTHIFSKLYNVSSQSEKEVVDSFDYLHGEAKINNTIETNNMVLGIDEYLSQKRRNKETEFIAFKKFYQRIYKQTGSEYKRWVEIIKNQIQEIDDKIKKQYPVQIPFNKIPNKCRNQLFIFGHSLDITDKDVLRDLILNDNVYTTIFYHNKDVMGQQIANLVKVIGQDELIRRTGGSTKTIEFKQQQDMVALKRQ